MENHKEGYISTNDAANIHYECFGDKNRATLLLLHGNGEELHYFDSQIKYFSPSYHIVAIDCRARGKSSRGTASLDFPTMMQDVLQVFDELQLNNVHLLGFSDGANLALHIAIRYPERLQSLILVGANYTPCGFRFSDYVDIRLTYYWLLFRSFFSTKIKLQKEIWDLMIHHPKLTLKQISAITIPALIITGQHDSVSQRQNDEIHQAIAGSKRIVVPNADHYLISKKPEIFNEIATAFLQSVSQTVK